MSMRDHICSFETIIIVVLATEHFVDCVCSMCTIIVCMLVRMRVVIMRV